jgi:hypothetical protein
MFIKNYFSFLLKIFLKVQKLNGNSNKNLYESKVLNFYYKSSSSSILLSKVFL